MSRRPIPITPHLSVEELARRYRQAPNPRMARRWQAIWLRAKGHSVGEVTALLGVHIETLRAWVKRSHAEEHGTRPTAPRRLRREYLYLFAVVCPSTGEAEWVIANSANTEIMNFHLQQLGRAHPDTLNVVVCDQAGWHGAHALAPPRNVALVYLPPYSPELNPVERLWLYLRDHFTVNTDFADLEALDRRLCEAIAAFDHDPGLLRSITRCEWWNVG